jgi:hypothetical protein
MFKWRKLMILIEFDSIVITLDVEAGGGHISSNMGEDPMCDDFDMFNSAIDGIESLILAHACAGIAVNSSWYVEGIKTAYEAVAQNLD